MTHRGTPSLIILCLASCCLLHAQQIRFESDPLPFILKGWVAALAVGSETWSVRILDARVDKPQWLLPSSVDNNRIHSDAILLDYSIPSVTFLKTDGMALSVGLVRWAGTIRNKELDETRAYVCELVSVGGALFYFLDSHFYLSPWAGLHLLVAGDRELSFSHGSYSIPRLNPEASVRIGYRFSI